MTTLRKPSPTAYIAEANDRTYLRPADLPGTPEAARKALARAAKHGDLVKCARGLYWKGPRTRYGMAAPDKVSTALEILGEEGTGPAGFTAARTWGLTTQVPAQTRLATIATKDATSLKGIGLSKRANARRRSLRYEEIGLLEVLRDLNLIEAGWPALVRAAKTAHAEGRINRNRINQAIPGEPPAVRQRWAKLETTLKG